MTDTSNTTPATSAEDSKAKTVLENMPQRRLFDTTDEATAYIEKCQTDYADFESYPVAAVGLTEEGGFDPDVYTDEMRVCVAVLTRRAKSEHNPLDYSIVHCIVINPAPKLDAITSTAAGLEWLTGIMEKELNHVAVRNLRKATSAQEIADAVESMPTTIGDYITSSRETTSGILETYNQLWQVIKKGIGAKSKPYALANLSKKEQRKAMESASYAATVYPGLETRTNKKGEPESLFVLAALFGQMLAKQQSLDSAIFDRMLAQRDEKEIEVTDDSDEDFDLEAMAAKLAQPAATEAPAEDSNAADEDDTAAE